MARPKKEGLDYYPLDVTFLNNIKIRRLKKRYGLTGIVAYVYLLNDIYAHSFYVELSDDYLWELSEYLEIDENKAKEIVETMVEVQLFDRKLYEQYAILSSKGVQSRYFSAKGKSALSHLLANRALSLLEIDPNVAVPEQKTPENGDLSAKNDGKKGQNPQSKVKESKVNNKSECARATARASFAEWKQTLLADEDWKASAVRQSGLGVAFNATLPRRIDDFCDWLVSTSEEASVRTCGDFARRFHYWWQYHGRKQEAGAGKQGDAKKSKLEEINRAGDEALTLARQMRLAG